MCRPHLPPEWLNKLNYLWVIRICLWWWTSENLVPSNFKVVAQRQFSLKLDLSLTRISGVGMSFVLKNVRTKISLTYSQLTTWVVADPSWTTQGRQLCLVESFISLEEVFRHVSMAWCVLCSNFATGRDMTVFQVASVADVLCVLLAPALALRHHSWKRRLLHIYSSWLMPFQKPLSYDLSSWWRTGSQLLCFNCGQNEGPFWLNCFLKCCAQCSKPRPWK